jgi:hypothetical protein
MSLEGKDGGCTVLIIRSLHLDEAEQKTEDPMGDKCWFCHFPTLWHVMEPFWALSLSEKWRK